MDNIEQSGGIPISLLINENRMHSKQLNRDIEVKWLFSDQLQEGDVQLLFVQDGYYYMKLGGLQETFEKLLEEKPELASNLVMITVSPGSPSQRREVYHPQGKHFNDFTEFFYEEVLPDVQQKLKAINMNVVKMGLMGDSLAGVISLYLAMQKPERWSHLLLQSSAFDEEMAEEAHRQIGQPDWKIYQVVGERENNFKSPVTGEITHIYDGNQRMMKVFEEKGLSLDYHVEDEEHRWVFWKDDLPRALCFFLKN
ncbi:alpha/beta hydrolase [Fictibacillus enclensis]|uniref:alpha/beta hydrolase n=1 Tax=Fictibacillus enclensis TaxID=1017270 RepID=UPI0024C07CE3|nr:alpha/beta hydrolase-fold protein [Fictibacillus enclensis]WHY72090.1 alpha/beta hydrolase-fold protein [Fictibacillus enclensis]